MNCPVALNAVKSSLGGPSERIGLDGADKGGSDGVSLFLSGYAANGVTFFNPFFGGFEFHGVDLIWAINLVTVE